MWPFDMSKKKKEEESKLKKTIRRKILLSTLCPIGGAVICAAIIIPIMLTTQCKNKNDGTKSIGVSISGDLKSGATLSVELFNGASWYDVSVSGTSWSKSTLPTTTFTKQDTQSTSDESVMISLSGGNSCTLNVPSGYIPNTLVTTSGTYTIDTSDNFMTSGNYLDDLTFRDTNRCTHTVNKSQITEIHLIDLPIMTGSVPANYGRMLCRNWMNLVVADIQFPASFPTTVGDYFCESMFYGCTSLLSLPPGFNLPSNITTIGNGFCYGMFENCALRSLPSGFNLPSGITTAGNDFCYYMFFSCISLTSDGATSPQDDIIIPNISPAPSRFCEYMFASSGILEHDSPVANEHIPIKRG